LKHLTQVNHLLTLCIAQRLQKLKTGSEMGQIKIAAFQNFLGFLKE